MTLSEILIDNLADCYADTMIVKMYGKVNGCTKEVFERLAEIRTAKTAYATVLYCSDMSKDDITDIINIAKIKSEILITDMLNKEPCETFSRYGISNMLNYRESMKEYKLWAIERTLGPKYEPLNYEPKN